MMNSVQRRVRETISVDEARERFAELLECVADGHEYIVMSDGRAVARITDVDAASKLTPAEREAAKQRLMEHLRSVKPMNAGKWTRDELYERDIPEAVREAAHEALFKRLESQPAVEVGPWTRDELYDDDPS